jgi:hypothetical protein
MAISASINLSDARNYLGSDREAALANINAAFSTWGSALAGNSTIQVNVTVSYSISGTLASAGARNEAYLGVVGGRSLYESPIAHQLRTGYNNNGSLNDIDIIINAYNLDEMYIDPNPYDGSGGLPGNRYDFVGLMIHEIGHGLGFYAYRSDTTGAYYSYKSVYDDYIQFVSGQPYFVGENVSRYYGSVPLTQNDLSHVGNESGAGEDLWSAMMAPYLDPGVRFSVTSLEKAMLADMGVGTNQADVLKVHMENTGRSVTLNAGAGTDTVVYSGNRSAYTVNYSSEASAYIVKGNGFTDSLLSAEKIRFNDGTFWVEDLAGITTGVHRFYNTATGTHFYTGSNAETYSVRSTAEQMNDEGFAFSTAKLNSGLDVFRFQNKETSAYFYTISTAERDSIIKNLPQFEYQLSSFKSYTVDLGPQEELYRFYNASTGAHFFTTSEAERDNISNNLPAFKYEGIAFYVDILS